MAKQNSKVQIRRNTIDENRIILDRIKSLKEIDNRKITEFEELFLEINSKCASGYSNEKSKSKIAEKQVENIQYGPIKGIPLGKWWGIRMDCSRDNVHKPFNENVFNGPFGAVSICTSHKNAYNDVDYGDFLTFTGQERVSDSSKESLILNHKNRIPVRLVRSYCLTNPYAPKSGYRYDGLYVVIDHWIGIHEDSKLYHKFALARIKNQGFIGKVLSKIKTPKRDIPPRLAKKIDGSPNFKVNSPLTRPKLIATRNFLNQNLNTTSNSTNIVSRQIFNKFTVDSQNSFGLCSSKSSKVYDTNISIRTGFYDSSCNNSVHFTGDKMSCLSYPNFPEEKDQVKISCIKQDHSEQLNYSDLSKSPTIMSDKKSDNEIKTKHLVIPLKATEELSNSNHINSGNRIQSQVSNVSKAFDKDNKPNIQQNTIDSQNVEKIASTVTNLAPDELVNIIDKAKNDPMAQLIIESMIGTNDKEICVSTLNILTSKLINTDSEDTNKLKCKNDASLCYKQKILSERKSRKKLSRQQREIANLNIDAKFIAARNSRSCKRSTMKKRLPIFQQQKRVSKDFLQRKFVNKSSRVNPQKHENKIVKLKKKPNLAINLKVDKYFKNNAGRSTETIIQSGSTSTSLNTTEIGKLFSIAKKSTKTSLMVNSSVQCSILEQPTNNKSIQTDRNVNCKEDDLKSTRLFDIDGSVSNNSVSEPRRSTADKIFFLKCLNLNGSAFAPVNSQKNNLSIARLRSIGFKPIQSSSSPNYIHHDTSEDLDLTFDQYMNTESNNVQYLNDDLSFEDIEDEDYKNCNVRIGNDSLNRSRFKKLSKKPTQLVFPPPPLEALKRQDFEYPGYNWKVVKIKGKNVWTELNS